jgi:hypothetical protein
MGSPIDRTGKVFGRLTALRAVGRDKRGLLWMCSCSCGTQKVIPGITLRRGGTRSCGCLRRLVGQRSLKHGHAPNRKRYANSRGQSSPTSEYMAYRNAKTRCTNRKTLAYQGYGRRGVKFLFGSFQDFIGHIGLKPSPRHSLGRMLDRGNYEPGNVFWMLPAEQGLNKRNNNALRKWELSRAPEHQAAA